MRSKIFQSPVAQWFPVVLILFFLFPLALRTLAQHPPPPGTTAPTQQEKTNWKNKIDRLEQNYTSWPISVSEAIMSLTSNAGLSFECPQGSPVAGVTVNITTALVHWDGTTAGHGRAGYYKWNATSSVQEGWKTINCQNYVMLDPSVATADENDPPLGPLADEALAYHELLHCQLLINAMWTSAWQAKACSCKFDDEPADGDHSEIYPATDSYMANRAPGINVKVIRPPAQIADGDGKFDIELGSTDKSTWTFQILEPTGGSNVYVDSVTVTKENGKFHVKGKLIDKTKKGKFFIRIDPADEWTFGGIESSIEVLPASAISTFTKWGLIIMILVVAGSFMFMIIRRRKVSSVR